jgi:uncharacterized protein with HEPN domain
MRRDVLLIGEMIEAAEQARLLVSGVDLEELATDRQRRDALLWNFTVLGEAASRLDDEVKQRHPEIPWAQPARLRNRIVHGLLVDRSGGPPHHCRQSAASVRGAAAGCSRPARDERLTISSPGSALHR